MVLNKLKEWFKTDQDQKSGRKKNRENPIDGNKRAKKWDNDPVELQFILRLDREIPVMEYCEKFLNNKENHAFFIFVPGKRSDKHQYLISRIKEKTRSENGKMGYKMIELINSDFLTYSQTRRNTLYFLKETFKDHYCYKGGKKGGFQWKDNANELLKQNCFNNTLLLLNHDISIEDISDVSKIQLTLSVLEKYIEFWNDCTDTKVALFFNIIDDIPNKMQTHPDGLKKITEDPIFKKILNNPYSIKLSDLEPIGNAHVYSFQRSVNNTNYHRGRKSLSIEQLTNGEPITMQQAYDIYKGPVEKFLLDNGLI